MPTPTTLDELVTNIRKSGLVPLPTLEHFLAEQEKSDDGLKSILERMVESELLTPFQADRMAAGKYKGFILGSYTILDRLGGGGMGQVFLAEHTVMHRLVALKVLSQSTSSDQVARERFLREARAAASLRHPNIIGVHDLRTDGPVYYLVMEYIEGITLQQLVAKGGKLECPVAAHYARQVALGLQHANEAGLVHRDIKPANLLLSRDGVVRILDLGLVRSAAETDSKLTSRLDRAILGTADYVAPEQAVNSSDVDTRADVYSLGATMYFLVAGRTLFPEGRTAQKLMWQQLREPTPIRELVPDLPVGFAAIIHKALSKDPEQRFQTPGDLASALVEFAADTMPTPSASLMPDPPRWKSRRIIRNDSTTGSSFGAASTSSSRAAATSMNTPDPTRTPDPKKSSKAGLSPPSLDRVDTHGANTLPPPEATTRFPHQNLMNPGHVTSPNSAPNATTTATTGNETGSITVTPPPPMKLPSRQSVSDISISGLLSMSATVERASGTKKPAAKRTDLSASGSVPKMPISLRSESNTSGEMPSVRKHTLPNRADLSTKSTLKLIDKVKKPKRQNPLFPILGGVVLAIVLLTGYYWLR